MHTRIARFLLCLMLILQGIPMLPAQAHSPCPAMSAHAGKAPPCHHRIASSLGAAKQIGAMHAPAAHAHDCASNCSAPCQLNVPAALTSAVVFALPRLLAAASPEPRRLQYGIRQDSIQRPPIA